MVAENAIKDFHLNEEVYADGTDYIGNVEYNFYGQYFSGILENELDYEETNFLRLNNPEGYNENLDYSTFNYYRRDHLGNNREVWRAPYKVGNTNYPAATTQRTQYYPSGLPWASNSVDYPGTQNKKYNGKEFVEMHGLDEYDSEARWYQPAIMRTTTIDPLAEKYYSISPYAWCGNNPVNAIDPDGMEFSASAWAYVKELMAEVQRKQDANDKTISDKQKLLDQGGLSKGRTISLNRQINNAKSANSELAQVRFETGTLAASSQMYDIKVDNSLEVRDNLGNVSTTGKTEWQNGVVVMSIPNGDDFNLLSHELKHGYQFETGNFSFSPTAMPFYDKYDELEGYQRGALFGGTSYNSINNLPSLYNNLQDGPASATSFIEQTTYRQYSSPYYESRSSMLAKQLHVLQRIATQNKAIFRAGGRTYKP